MHPFLIWDWNDRVDVCLLYLYLYSENERMLFSSCLYNYESAYLEIIHIYFFFWHVYVQSLVQVQPLLMQYKSLHSNKRLCWKLNTILMRLNHELHVSGVFVAYILLVVNISVALLTLCWLLTFSLALLTLCWLLTFSVALLTICWLLTFCVALWVQLYVVM